MFLGLCNIDPTNGPTKRVSVSALPLSHTPPQPTIVGQITTCIFGFAAFNTVLAFSWCHVGCCCCCWCCCCCSSVYECAIFFPFFRFYYTQGISIRKTKQRQRQTIIRLCLTAKRHLEQFY